MLSFKLWLEATVTDDSVEKKILPGQELARIHPLFKQALRNLTGPSEDVSVSIRDLKDDNSNEKGEKYAADKLSDVFSKLGKNPNFTDRVQAVQNNLLNGKVLYSNVGELLSDLFGQSNYPKLLNGKFRSDPQTAPQKPTDNNAAPKPAVSPPVNPQPQPPVDPTQQPPPQPPMDPSMGQQPPMPPQPGMTPDMTGGAPLQSPSGPMPPQVPKQPNGMPFA